MSQLPNSRSLIGQAGATVLMVCALCVHCAPTVASNIEDAGMGGTGLRSLVPANAAIELQPVSQESSSTVDPEQLTMEDAAPVARENIVIRRRGHTLSAGTLPAPLPWYRSGLASLGLVLGVIILVALGFKRATKTSRGGGGGVLQVLTRTHLSPKQSIAVVQMGGRLVFVGITPEQISTLRVVEDREEAALLRGQLRVGDAQSGGMAFDKHLSREAKELADGQDIGAEVRCGAPNPQLGTKEDLRGLLDRLRDFQGGRSQGSSTRRKLATSN